MPIHFKDLDVATEAEGLCSVLIIPCYMCPAVTVAVRDEKPFIQLLSHFLKSPPFERHLKQMQFALKAKGIESRVFKSRFIYQRFMCMWSAAQRRKLKRLILKYDAAIILGCESAIETVHELVEATDCRLIQGMEVLGFMNAKMRFRWPCDVTFDDCKIVPIAQQAKVGDTQN
jgi:hypothetical protein